MTQRKPKQCNSVHFLNGEQQQALGKFQKDLKTAMPHIVAMAETGKKLHQAMIDSPVWRVVDAPQPEQPPEEPEVWTVGHAQVNYVDHIKTEGTQ